MNALLSRVKVRDVDDVGVDPSLSANLQPHPSGKRTVVALEAVRSDASEV